MKIAHIAPPWLPIPPKHYGGTELVIANLIDEQVAQGHDVTLFAPGDAKTAAKLVSFFPQSLIESGIPWQAHLKAFYHFYKTVEYIQAHHFDIVHMHLSSAADMYLFPLTAPLNVPRLMTLHSRFPFDRVGAWMGDADTLYMEWARTMPMVAISEAARDEVSHPLNFVGIVHHGLPLDKYVPSVKQPENYFAWVGRIIPDKGVHLAIQAAKQAGVPLVLAGTVDTHLPECVEYFEQQIKPHIDGQQIRYIGPVDMAQKTDLLSRAIGFLNPIQWEEPFGMVMIESMAFGCPVISFARGAAPELIVHGKTGFLVHDTNEMARYIARIGKLDRSAVRAHVQHNFSVQAMAEKYHSLYKKLIASSRPAATTVATSTRMRPPMPMVPLTAVEPAALAYKLSVEKAEIEPMS